MSWFNGKKTIISLVLALLFKFLATKGFVITEEVQAIVSAQILEIISAIGIIAGIFFRMKADQPGVLAK